ncbi:MAG: hypothetical protein JWM04_1571 [Verrucomicrobiales bacterium]|nr:hypothetical protein [Verrucomicrobiales bacterium]
MKRVLIISPHFPPINAPDHQRVRMALPYFVEFGWEATVIATAPEFVEGTLDPLLKQSLDAKTRIFWEPALPTKWTRKIGLGNLGLRCIPYVHRRAKELLTEEKFDVVFFSTTMFAVMALGPAWKRNFGIPYVLDFQDPWVMPYYDTAPGVSPPGGRFKHAITQTIAKNLEPMSVKGASQIMSVSPAYPEAFCARYPELKPEVFTVLPFGASEADYTFVRENKVEQSEFDPNDGKEHWVYVGRGGPDMKFCLTAFFMALAKEIELKPELREKLRFHFIGTSYAKAGSGEKSIEPIAKSFGLDDIVMEKTDRIPYFEAISCMQNAHALFVPGSDDPGYTASKIYPTIMAGKPVLSIFHESSTVNMVMKETGAGLAISFKSSDGVRDLAQKIAKSKWRETLLQRPQGPDLGPLESYTARAMTQKICIILNKCPKARRA